MNTLVAVIAKRRAPRRSGGDAIGAWLRTPAFAGVTDRGMAGSGHDMHRHSGEGRNPLAATPDVGERSDG